MAEEIEIEQSSEEAVLGDTAAGTSTKNDVSEEDLGKIDQDASASDTPPVEGEKPKEPKKISKTYYKAFSNGALNMVDKGYEFLAEFIYEPEVSKDGLKVRNPQDFQENIELLAEQLELTESQIAAWMGWVMVASVIMLPYGKLIKQGRKESLEIKKKREAFEKDQKDLKNNAEPVTESVEQSTHLQQENIKSKIRQQASASSSQHVKGLSKNWKLHPQPCDCPKCKDPKNRDIDGNIITHAEVVK